MLILYLLGYISSDFGRITNLLYLFGYILHIIPLITPFLYPLGCIYHYFDSWSVKKDTNGTKWGIIDGHKHKLRFI